MKKPLKRRWTPHAKLEVVDQFRSGATLNELVAEHGVTAEEILDWRDLHHKHGLAGLSSKRVQLIKKRRVRAGVIPGPLSPEEAAFRARNAIWKQGMIR